jgi:predicted RNase H-related nuclease YkuK (DUF458 family)
MAGEVFMIFDIEEIKEYIKDNPEMRVIIGGDSQKISGKGKRRRTKTKSARFVTCVICYTKDKNKIFYEVSREKDMDHNPSKPMMRMMQETQKIVDVTMKIMDTLIECDTDFEVHLDINPKKEHGSNCAMASAVGYVWGLVGIEPIIKPESWAASPVADWIVKNNKDVLNYTGETNEPNE